MRVPMSRLLKVSLLLVPAMFVLAGAESESVMELNKTSSAERLVAAIERHTETLSEYLAEEASFKDNLKHDQIVSRASSVALLAHGLMTLKKSPASVNPVIARKAAQQIATAETYADAKAGLEMLKTNSTSSDIVIEDLGWDEVAGFNAVMEELKELLGGLKRTHRRSRDPEADSLDAMTVAVLAYAVKSELSYAFDEADEKKWQQYATKMHDDFTALDAAMRAKDTDKTREIYDTITESCAACHKDFREQE